MGITEACQRITKLKLEGGTFLFYPYLPNEIWRFTIVYPEHLRVITQSKEVDIHSLIGNIGGYLGLFIGKAKFNSIWYQSEIEKVWQSIKCIEFYDHIFLL